MELHLVSNFPAMEFVIKSCSLCVCVCVCVFCVFLCFLVCVLLDMFEYFHVPFNCYGELML
ncbi:hypothetical protein QJS10_CPA08g01747 [Acorus calamus]|uniref:Uncharacterized protein n=1 Tax=Acorus calamus TaxID=4465 RepID=A0AAV9EE85_ACOCL|nr:hypothetical protein QJS10_CPA08g01747 [Acorus calamus]